MKNIHRVLKDVNHPFVRVDKGFINDPNLSWKAKGILTYLLSKPDSWVMVQEDIQSHGTDGRIAVKTGIDELKKAGYIKRIPVHNGKKITHWETKIFETPQLKENYEENVK